MGKITWAGIVVLVVLVLAGCPNPASTTNGNGNGNGGSAGYLSGTHSVTYTITLVDGSLDYSASNNGYNFGKVINPGTDSTHYEQGTYTSAANFPISKSYQIAFDGKGDYLKGWVDCEVLSGLAHITLEIYIDGALKKSQTAIGSSSNTLNNTLTVGPY